MAGRWSTIYSRRPLDVDLTDQELALLEESCTPHGVAGFFSGGDRE
jgi:hypothetical protein